MLFSPYNGDPATLPALTLAYIGDAVYELYVRKVLLSGRALKVHDLHEEAVKKVNALAQADLFIGLKDILTEEEKAVAGRGRNANSAQVPKNIPVGKYRLATGLEALIGYLFLKGSLERIEELLVDLEKVGE